MSDLFFGIMMLILNFLTSCGDGSWTRIEVPSSIIEGLFFGAIMSLVWVHKIKVMKDGD